MNKKLLSMLLTAAVLSSAALTGCGQSSGTAASTETQSTAKSGVVALSATFPDSAGAIKSLIPSGTQSIEVYASDKPISPYYSPGMDGGTLLATLTAAAPTATVRMLPGNYYIAAIAFDSTDTATRRAIAFAMSGGTIIAGSNSVELTFANGTWTITDANGGALTLTDGTVLKDMVIGGEMGRQAMYKKSAIDYSKPVGYGSGMLRYRFANNTSARTYGGMESQFNGTSKTNSLYSDMYNVTRKCSSFNNYSTCDERKGDHLIMVSSGPDNEDNYYNNEGIKQGNAYELLPNKGQTSFNKDMTSMFTETSFTNGKTISGALLEVVATTDRTSAIKTTGATAAKSVAAAVKSASANTSISGVAVTDYEYIIYNPGGGTNKGGWQFHDRPKQTSDGKTYYTGGYLQPSYTTGSMVYNAGDYSFGLVPTTTNLGEYCHQFDYQNKTCLQQKPASGDVYYPWNFWDLNGNGVIDYGSFQFQFYAEETQSYNVFKYMFTATGK